MVGRALSDTKKKQNIHEVEEKFRLHAIAAYRLELAKPEGKRQSSRTVARDFICLYKQETGHDLTLDHSLLCRRAVGGNMRMQANAARSWLTDEEQEIIIGYMVECGSRGFPLSHRRLWEHVNGVLQARLGGAFPIDGVGKNWTNCFIEKHSDRLKMSWATPLEAKRGRAVNEQTINAFYDILEHVTEKYEINFKLIYGVDEFGTNPFNGERERVIGGVGNDPRYQLRDGNRENITVIVTICADGTTTPPATIFKGQAFQVKWKQDNPANSS